MRQQTITTGQFGILVFFFTIGTSILITPSRLAFEAKQSAWLPACIGIGIGLILITILQALVNQFPEISFVQACEKILGKWVGKCVALLYVFFSFTGATTLLWIVGNFLATQIFPETPMIALNIPFAIAVVFGVRSGIQTLARGAQIFMPWIVLLFFTLVLFTIKDSKVVNILPLLDVQVKPITRSTLSFFSITSMPLVVLLMVSPKVANLKTEKKAFMLGHVSGGLILIVTTLVTILVFGDSLTSLQSYPTYVLAKKIKIGTFLSRIEVLLAFIWIVTIYYKCTLYFYASVYGLSQVINLKNYNILSLPLGVLMVANSVGLYHDAVYASIWDVRTWVPFAFTFGVFLPFVLLLINFCKKKLRKGQTSS